MPEPRPRLRIECGKRALRDQFDEPHAIGDVLAFVRHHYRIYPVLLQRGESTTVFLFVKANSSAVREIPARLAASRIAAAVAKPAGTVTGAEFDVINYPDAHHGFDQERKTIRYKGHTLAYSAEATSDSRKRVREFFLRHLTEELKAKAPVSSNPR